MELRVKVVLGLWPRCDEAPPPSETTVCILCPNSVVMHLLTQHMRKPLVLGRGRGQERVKTLKWLPPKYVGRVLCFVVSAVLEENFPSKKKKRKIRTQSLTLGQLRSECCLK